MFHTLVPKKLKRATKACDYCHEKRVKCVKVGESCVTCNAKGINCTFTVPVNKRGPIPGRKRSKKKTDEIEIQPSPQEQSSQTSILSDDFVQQEIIAQSVEPVQSGLDSSDSIVQESIVRSPTPKSTSSSKDSQSSTTLKPHRILPPSDLPKPAIPIPLSVLLSDIHHNIWTPESFPPIEIEHGQTKPWLQVYFENVNPRFPILPEQWTMKNCNYR